MIYALLLININIHDLCFAFDKYQLGFNKYSVSLSLFIFIPVIMPSKLEVMFIYFLKVGFNNYNIFQKNWF